MADDLGDEWWLTEDIDEEQVQGEIRFVSV